MRLIIDTETTGLGKDAEAIEIAIIDADTCEIYFDERIKPTAAKIEEGAARVHGITHKDLANKQPFYIHAPKIFKLLSNAKIVFAYNAEFDSRIFYQTVRATKLDDKIIEHYTVWSCLMNTYSKMYGEYNHRTGGNDKRQKLENAVKQQGIDCSDLNAHNALDDCLMTQRLFKVIEKGIVMPC
jgi:DNA polymerase-3 subunit epsilon